MRNAVIVGFKRSPFTMARKGEMAEVRPEDILSQTINSLINETKINKDDIEDIITGCAYPEGAQGNAGAAGADGDSAFEIAVDNGFVGNEADWLASLVGAQGPAGALAAESFTSDHRQFFSADALLLHRGRRRGRRAAGARVEIGAAGLPAGRPCIS